MLAALCETGTLKLSTRYALQKGMLIDVGTALVPNAVSEIRAGGQFFAFISAATSMAATSGPVPGKVPASP